MKRTQLLTAAAVLIVCGCTESPTGPTYPISVAPPELSVLSGTVVTQSSRTRSVSLRLETGDMVELVGLESQRLVALEGASVQLGGSWTTVNLPTRDTDISVYTGRSAFVVGEFLVLAVGGRPAMDGVLEARDGKYYLQLTAGDVFWFDDTPSDFNAYIGKRVWVAGSMDDPPLTFGVID